MDEKAAAEVMLHALPARLPEGKDELNLAEFPLCCVADRTQPDQKTMVFEDRVWDANRGEMITRQLLITGSDQYGLPTARDDEVLLGLIQLSKHRDFADRQVYFTRYQLIRLLGWRDESKGYERLETSVNRWVGVTLYYKNAWWNRDQQCWVDEKFHVLDNVTLYDREKARRSPARGRQSHLPLSSFVWNEVIFRSFRAGNLKSLDFDFFKRLDSAIAKRLYRFLDKRFFHRPRWEFNLKELAWEHIGLSRTYDTANLKRKLRPAFAELEEHRFLKPLPDHERFRKVSSGEWRVVCERPSAEVSPPQTPTSAVDEAATLKEALVQRGVTLSTAQVTVAGFAAERIRGQLEVFDWLVNHGDAKVSRNPAGFLISSIKSEYAPPKGFVTAEERARRESKAAERKHRLEQRQREAEVRQQVQARAQEEAIARFWKSLSDEERTRLENEALAGGSSFQRELVERGGALARSARQAILDAYALKMMQIDG